MKKIFLILQLLISITTFAQSNKDAIRIKIKDHLKDVETCYEESLKQNAILHGKVVVDFDVNDSGSVKKSMVNTSKSTLNDEKVHACITEKMLLWKFPAAPKGQIISISYPFVFEKLTH